MTHSRLFQHLLLSLCFLNNWNFHEETRAASLTVMTRGTPFGNPSNYPFRRRQRFFPYLLKFKHSKLITVLIHLVMFKAHFQPFTRCVQVSLSKSDPSKTLKFSREFFGFNNLNKYE